MAGWYHWATGTTTPTEENLRVSYVNASRALTDLDQLIVCNASAGEIILTVPLSTDNSGKIYRIVKVDNSINDVVLARSGGDIIGENESLIIDAKSQTVEIIGDGISSWLISGSI